MPKREEYNPFNRFKVVSLIQRPDGTTFERPHKRFEYWGQTVEEGKIIGIYTRHKKSKELLEHEELIAKWR